MSTNLLSANPDLEWVANFTIDSYKPMTRLLAEEDYRFLESQAGYKPELASKLRNERRSILREYLSNFERDFKRLHRTARMLAAYDAESGTAESLFSQYFTFWLQMRVIRLSLWIPDYKVNLDGLLSTMSAVRGRVSAFLPDAAG